MVHFYDFHPPTVQKNFFKKIQKKIFQKYTFAHKFMALGAKNLYRVSGYEREILSVQIFLSE